MVTGVIVDVDHFAQNSGRAAESPAPEPIADHGYCAGTGCSIIRRKDCPAQDRLHLQLLIEVAGNQLSIRWFSSTIDGYVHASEPLERKQVFEHTDYWPGAADRSDK